MFFLSAFDRPFDKTADGRELPTRVTEGYLEGDETAEQVNEELHGNHEAQPAVAGAQPAVAGAQPAVVGGGTIVIQGGGGATAAAPTAETESAPAGEGGTAQLVGGNWVAQQQEISPDMQEAQSSYVDELKKLVETLSKVNEQSERLTRDSEEMENLNRTLTGISRVYEMQLKGASQQIGTIDQINEQSRHLAEQIEKLNQIYARMIEAMTVNMPRAAAPQQPTVQQ